MAALFALAELPLFRAADSPPGAAGKRVSALDGLRGFLALGVFFHHAAIYHRFLIDGNWELPPSGFYILQGQVGVSLFFVITGYLFWSRLVKNRGRLEWMNFYINRAFRIGPLYLVAVAVMFGTVIARTGLQLSEPWFEFSQHIFEWLALGAIRGGDINGYGGTQHVIGGVTWSLQYEWCFYGALVVIAVSARRLWTHLAFSIGGLSASLTYLALNAPTAIVAPPSVGAALFFSGMTCASLQSAGWFLRLPNWLSSGIASGALAALFAAFTTAIGAMPIILMAGIFCLIVSGSSIFGLLTCRSAQRFGNISYGIYLLQGLVLAIVFSAAPIRAFALASTGQYWIVMLLCSVLVVAGATLAHAAVERPGIRLGKATAAWIMPSLDSRAVNSASTNHSSTNSALGAQNTSARVHGMNRVASPVPISSARRSRLPNCLTTHSPDACSAPRNRQ
jgi:peptidoglycan/LPS O-acetylase OafA/YrhL